MTGGGFGGCTVNLVESDCAEAFQKDIGAEYEGKTGIKPDIYTFTPAAGAEKVMDGYNASGI
jgi:Galactokinase